MCLFNEWCWGVSVAVMEEDTEGCFARQFDVRGNVVFSDWLTGFYWGFSVVFRYRSNCVDVRQECWREGCLTHGFSYVSGDVVFYHAYTASDSPPINQQSELLGTRSKEFNCSLRYIPDYMISCVPTKWATLTCHVQHQTCRGLWNFTGQIMLDYTKIIQK